jgi:hypothetical protein
MKMGIKLSEDEVKEAVILYLEMKHQMKVKTVSLVVGNLSVGYGPMETTQPGFKYVECEVEK